MHNLPALPDTPALSEGARLVDTFVAPGKTFTDILRSTSWWGPFIVMILAGLLFSYSVDRNVGFDNVAHQTIARMSTASQQIDSLPPDQRAERYHSVAVRMKYQAYGSSVFILLFGLVTSLLWWAGLNFGLGANTKFSQIFAIWMYAGLPRIIIYLLAAGLLFAGVGIDSFDIQNPVGTNLGYYLPDSMHAIKAAASFLDVFGLWSMVLAVIGTAIVARKKASQTAIVIFGWWIVGMILVAAAAAIFA